MYFGNEQVSGCSAKAKHLRWSILDEKHLGSEVGSLKTQLGTRPRGEGPEDTCGPPSSSLVLSELLLRPLTRDATGQAVSDDLAGRE